MVNESFSHFHLYSTTYLPSSLGEVTSYSPQKPPVLGVNPTWYIPFHDLTFKSRLAFRETGSLGVLVMKLSRLVRIHYWPSLSPAETYDRSQYDNAVKDGDVMVSNDGRTVSILIEAWPTCVFGDAGINVLHTVDVRTMDDGKYMRSWELANCAWIREQRVRAEMRHLEALPTEEWDVRYARYRAAMERAGRTEMFTREEYPQRCIDWVKECG